MSNTIFSMCIIRFENILNDDVFWTIISTAISCTFSLTFTYPTSNSANTALVRDFQPSPSYPNCCLLVEMCDLTPEPLLITLFTFLTGLRSQFCIILFSWVNMNVFFCIVFENLSNIWLHCTMWPHSYQVVAIIYQTACFFQTSYLTLNRPNVTGFPLRRLSCVPRLLLFLNTIRWPNCNLYIYFYFKAFFQVALLWSEIAPVWMRWPDRARPLRLPPVPLPKPASAALAPLASLPTPASLWETPSVLPVPPATAGNEPRRALKFNKK